MIAFLGMYDMPALRAANDTYWSAIRRHLGFGPETLTRKEDPWPLWQSPDLLFAQTCGYPYRARLHGQVQLVGTPDFGLPDCPPGHYNSVLIARKERPGGLDSFDKGLFAYNEALSQSGWAGPMTYLNERGIGFGGYVETGAHAASAQAVLAGHADLAGIDALTWRLLLEHVPDMSRLRVVDTTTATPGLPYITSSDQDPEALFTAVASAIDALPPQTRKTLHLKTIVAIPAQDYLQIPTPPAPPQS